ncbi:hypothetical protein [Frigoribacterium sp. VKM Ac-2530]|uniref:hypothetical protein n=1 Tax=Frigoribacterium sp. VKM Ac-2530 TaxID=2783822 RepID=UPI00188A71DF|nr:hypothetical protein [Frigoribacterium sp. VKM Ac-2530]MBF4578965.1 hypothetical protein [Frigoribacterium sp. VKM Ac-2530]
MRPSTRALREALTGSFTLEYEADLFYDGERLFKGLPIEDASLRGDASGEVEESGTVTVVWTDDQGSSLKPSDPQDWLAPYGARVVLFAVVSVGNVFRERVQLGDYTITAVPSADDSVFMFGETRVTVGSRIQLELKDRMVEVQRDRFTRLSSPQSLISVWDEIKQMTGLQVTRSVPDKALTRSVTYEESRVSAVIDLMALLDASPYMEWDGTLTARPNAPAGPVGELKVGPNGTITQIGSSLDAEGVYNGIVIRLDGAEGGVLAELWVERGPLRATAAVGTRTPFHNVPRFYSNPQIETEAQARAAAPGLLEMYSQPRAASLEIQCIADPTVQVGDVRTVDDGTFTWVVRIATYNLSAAPTMTIRGDVLSRAINVD